MSLHDDMRQVLARLELISHAPAARIDPNPVHASHDAHRPPTGEHAPPHLTYRDHWNRCHGDTGRRAVLKAAQEELQRLQHAPQPTEPEWGTYWWKVKIANDDQPIETISRLYSIGKSTVSKYRKLYRADQAA